MKVATIVGRLCIACCVPYFAKYKLKNFAKILTLLIKPAHFHCRWKFGPNQTRRFLTNLCPKPKYPTQFLMIYKLSHQSCSSAHYPLADLNAKIHKSRISVVAKNIHFVVNNIETIADVRWIVHRAHHDNFYPCSQGCDRAFKFVIAIFSRHIVLKNGNVFVSKQPLNELWKVATNMMGINRLPFFAFKFATICYVFICGHAGCIPWKRTLVAYE